MVDSMPLLPLPQPDDKIDEIDELLLANDEDLYL